jgi:hypothetical protein
LSARERRTLRRVLGVEIRAAAASRAPKTELISGSSVTVIAACRVEREAAARNEMTPMADDALVLQAAAVIRSELPSLVPGQAVEVGAALDELLRRAEATEGDERADIVDSVTKVLAQHGPIRTRLSQLLTTGDVTRGIGEVVWAADQQLPGALGRNRDVISITCSMCGFVNLLAYRPPENDPGYCQNTQSPRHVLELA